MFNQCFTIMKPTYKFFVRTDRKGKNEKAPVYLRITYNRKSKYYNTGIRILSKHWSKRSEEVKSSHPSAKVFNQELKQLRMEVQQIGFDLDRKERISARNIANLLKGKNPSSFTDFAEKYLTYLRKTGSVRRSKQTKVILNKICRFTGEEQLEFGDITPDFLRDLDQYMRKVIGNHQNTVRKDYERLKMIFDEAKDRELIDESPFDRYKMPARQKSKKEALTYKQIKDIEALELDKESLIYHVRNYFLFSFYNAGIRFGDLCKLKWSNIQDGRLKYLMGKSQNNRSPKYKNIKLNDYSYEILKDYRSSGSEDDYIFPILDTSKDLDDPEVFDRDKSSKNSMVNNYLKKIAKKAGIELSLSFHISRHSFARHAANSGMNIYAVSNALAHSDIKTTQNYLNGFNESLLDREMGQLF